MSSAKPSDKPLGIAFIVSAPSGSGKTTLIQELLKRLTRIAFSVSATTRQPRPGEVSGKDYHFLGPTEFDRMVAQGAFLEWATVHGERYGTLKKEFDQNLAEGIDVILEIDVQGAEALRDKVHSQLVTVFVLPKNPEILYERLKERKKDSVESIERRLKTAKTEVRCLSDYDYLIINDKLAKAVDELAAIVVAERCRLEYKHGLTKAWQQAMKQWQATG